MKVLKVAAVGVFTPLFLALAGSLAVAQTTWKSSPTTNDVNAAGNWESGLPSATVDAHFATSSTTNLAQSGPITIRDMIFDAGASAFKYGIASGQLSLLNSGSPAGNIVENNSVATQVIGNTTGAGGAIGVAGFINAAAGDIVINGAINVGNGTTDGNSYLALKGSHNVYFNVDPGINALGNLSGGAWTSAVNTNMHSRAFARFFLGQSFSGRAYFGDIGTIYEGTINVDSQANGALRLTNNNSLGTSIPLSHHPNLQINGGATGTGTLELAPATGAGISVARDVMFVDGRSGAAADDPHLLNVSGNNTLSFATDWNTGNRTPFGTTSTASSNTIFNAGNWNLQSDAGTLNISGTGTMYNTQNVPITLQLMGQANGTINVPINKSGTAPTVGIVKKGTGTWTLTNANQAAAGTVYDGAVTVQQGTLALTGAGSLANAASIDVRSGGILDVSGVTGGIYSLNSANLKTTGAGTITGNFVAGNSNTIAPGNGVTSGASIGTLTYSNALTLDGGGALSMELTGTPTNLGGINDKIAVQGNLALNGSTTVTISPTSGSLGNGTYTLLSYSGTLSGGVGNIDIQGLPNSQRQIFSKSDSTAGQINLIVTGNAANLTWVGGVNGNAWVDGQLEANSINWTGAADNHFYDGDNVTFSNTGTTVTPTISGTVNPSSISFTNGAGKNYKIGGGAVNTVGPTSLSGAGNVTFENSATTLGNVTISGSGDLDVTTGSFAATGAFIKGGAGTVTFSNSNSSLSLTTLAINGGTVTVDRTDDLTGASGLSFSTSGAGTFRKQNTNTVDVSGDNSGFTGTTIVESGTLQTRSANALTSTTVAAGATLDLGNNGIAGSGGGTKAVSLAGTGVGGNGALTVTTAGNSNGNNAHIGALTLTDDATIRIKSPDSGVPNRAILWVDGAINGNGKALTAIIDIRGDLNTASFNTGTEVDFVNNGVTNLGSLNLSGGGVLFIGGTTDLGPSGTITLGDTASNSAGVLGIYGNQMSSGTPVSITKPISVTSVGGGLNVFRNSGSYTISSPISLAGNLDLSTTVSADDTTNKLILSGNISGTTAGNLSVHLSANASLTRLGVVETTGTNTYQGTTTIGGSANDRMSLNVNGTHTGGGAYAVNTSGKLGGTGTITADVTVNSGGTLGPGASVGTLTVGSVLFNTDSKLLIEFNGDSDTIDKLVVTGALDITSAILDFDNLGAGVLNGSPTIFASYGSLTGTFSAPIDLPGGYTIDYNFLNSKQIALVGGPATLQGDYNNNGVVDGADYVVWRNGGSPDSSQAGYNLWRSNFGNHLGSGSELGGNAAVPEPGTVLLAIFAVVASATSGRSLRRR